MRKKNVIPVIFLMFVYLTFGTACYKIKIFQFGASKYSGDIDFSKYTWIAGKKIFIDAGHGGKGESDRFRIGPAGITEEEINLRVAMILEDMLERAGAVVRMSRRSDRDISLDDRVESVNDFLPDLLISLHHNGSVRRMDKVNYPAVLIWGNKKVSPASYDFAEILLEEFHRFTDTKGLIVSDFSIFKETGTKILRETRYTCPGIIGEPGFFSDPEAEKKLDDILYNQEESEAYFNAISTFFKRGIPAAEVLISCPVENEFYYYNLIKEKNPVIAIKTDSGLGQSGILKGSLTATLDGVKVNCRPVADDLFFIEYGSLLYPGGHAIKFSFRNQLNRSSMIYAAGFTVEINKGDYDRLRSDGKKLLSSRNMVKRKEGLKMLLSALSMGTTDPDADEIIWHIARGFSLTGDRVNSGYYYSKLYNFYPQSRYSKVLERRFKDYRFPVEYNGKGIEIKYEASLKDESIKKK